MLADPEIDVIDICTPRALHPSQAIAAARAGKCLIIEKPIALTRKDAEKVPGGLSIWGNGRRDKITCSATGERLHP